MQRSVVGLAALSLLTLAGCDSGGTASGTDAAGRDAATVDAPGTDANVDAAASGEDGGTTSGDDAGTTTAAGCAGHDYLFCEDWESATGSALPAGWTLDHGWMNGDPSVTTEQHHGGTHALHGAIAESGQNRAQHSIAALGAAAGHHWGRVYYRVTAPAFVPPAGTVNHATLLALLGTGEARVVDTVMSDQGTAQFLLNTPDDHCCVGSDYDYASFDGAWHCAEWYVEHDTDSYRFFYDGTEVTSLAYTGTNGIPVEIFDSVTVGLRNYQTATTPYDAYFDDLVIDDTRVGCD